MGVTLAIRLPNYNLIIINVRGLNIPLYLLGAKMQGRHVGRLLVPDATWYWPFCSAIEARP